MYPFSFIKSYANNKISEKQADVSHNNVIWKPMLIDNRRDWVEILFFFFFFGKDK